MGLNLTKKFGAIDENRYMYQREKALISLLFLSQQTYFYLGTSSDWGFKRMMTPCSMSVAKHPSYYCNVSGTEKVDKVSRELSFFLRLALYHEFFSQPFSPITSRTLHNAGFPVANFRGIRFGSPRSPMK